MITRRAFISCMAAAALAAAGLSACSQSTPASAAGNTPTPTNSSATANAPAVAQAAADARLTVTVNNSSFKATFADTEAARQFQELLPLTIALADLNGNEKFVYMDQTLTPGTDRPERMEAGQIMLYGADCLVVFYEGFANSYGGYSSIATIDDPSGLASALGHGPATITFSRE